MSHAPVKREIRHFCKGVSFFASIFNFEVAGVLMPILFLTVPPRPSLFSVSPAVNWTLEFTHLSLCKITNKGYHSIGTYYLLRIV